VKKRILIVDEEKGVGATFEAILKNNGFDTDYFTDPAVDLEKQHEVAWSPRIDKTSTRHIL